MKFRDRTLRVAAVAGSVIIAVPTVVLLVVAVTARRHVLSPAVHMSFIQVAVGAWHLMRRLRPQITGATKCSARPPRRKTALKTGGICSSSGRRCRA